MEMRPSVVQVTFAERNSTYSYYNDQFDLKRGDFVYVEGEMEGMLGCVLEVHYNFKVRRSVIKRVTGLVDGSGVERPILGCPMYITCDRSILDENKATAWFGVREEEEDAFFCGSGDPAFSLNELEGMKLSLQEARYGAHEFVEGRVELVCLNGKQGYAIYGSDGGYSKPHLVRFEYRGGMISELSCSCGDNFNCGHEFAAMLQLKEVMKGIEAEYKEEYEMSQFFAAVSVRKVGELREVIKAKKEKKK